MDDFKNIDFVIGYLQQTKRMQNSPPKIYDILIFLCEEISKINIEMKKKKNE